jgi:hypothetical protein
MYVVRMPVIVPSDSIVNYLGKEVTYDAAYVVSHAAYVLVWNVKHF